MKRKVTFSFIALSIFSSFFSFQFPQILSLRMYCLLFLDFFFCLSTFLFGEGFASFALPSIFSASSSGESPTLTLSFRPVLLSEFTTGEIGFGWCWFSCWKSLIKLFCHIAERIFKLFGEFLHRIFRVTKRILRLLQELDRSLHEQSRKMEDWAPSWDEIFLDAVLDKLSFYKFCGITL